MASLHSHHELPEDTASATSRRWPVAHLADYRQEKETASYLVEWRPSYMTLDELCEDFYGQPLLSLAVELSPKHYPSSGATTCQYTVKWKQTWVPLSELADCAWLVHEFWTKRIGLGLYAPTAELKVTAARINSV
ncbi:hypothetical protein K469DRAFT_132703 [Zopfia rhizophila CBS 207.26]|uniref:Chromo domain-containing protein n=1 Tax=Zopfia rhizophila CBS 207.26 TaxID=1314779 RepID=A0A6A6EU69_9PEZI|nr:hypothetical protein K469DRAFT_132703 [Zopfia rhizophila CBS 207.26]